MRALVLVLALAGLACAFPQVPQEPIQIPVDDPIQIPDPVPILTEEPVQNPDPITILVEDPIQILVDDRVQPEGGAYAFNIQTENGISQSEQGLPGVEGQSNVQGSYSFLQEDGSVVEVRYIANEYGFQVDHPLLPVAPEFPHPLPQFVLDQIAFGEEQRRLRAQGQVTTVAVNVEKKLPVEAQVLEPIAPAVDVEVQENIEAQDPLPLEQ